MVSSTSKIIEDKIDGKSSIEIELNEFSKDELIHIILSSVKMNMTIEEFFVYVITKACEEFAENNKSE
jgi:hypothetical protein